MKCERHISIRNSHMLPSSRSHASHYVMDGHNGLPAVLMVCDGGRAYQLIEPPSERAEVYGSQHKACKRGAKA